MRPGGEEGQSRAAPESPSAALELARAEADAGLTGRALESYARAERLAGGLSAVKRKWLDETVRTEKHALLLEAARRTGAAKRWDEADGLFKQAADAEFAAPVTPARIALETAELWKTAGRADRAAAVGQAISGVKELSGLMVRDETGVPRHAAELVCLSRPAATFAAQDAVSEQAPPSQPPYFRSWQAAARPWRNPTVRP